MHVTPSKRLTKPSFKVCSPIFWSPAFILDLDKHRSGKNWFLLTTQNYCTPDRNARDGAHLMEETRIGMSGISECWYLNGSCPVITVTLRNWAGMCVGGIHLVTDWLLCPLSLNAMFQTYKGVLKVPWLIFCLCIELAQEQGTWTCKQELLSMQVQETTSEYNWKVQIPLGFTGRHLAL